MKKIFLNKALAITLFAISGMLSLIIVILLFIGKIDFGNSNVLALEKGNKFYVTNKYDKALEAYKQGLSKSKDDAKLNNNSAMASYNLKNYSDALTYLSKTPEKTEKHMKIGNSNFKLGEANSDTNMKVQLFQKALEAYKQGIIKYPQDVELKFNYEFVKKKLDELQNKDDQKDQQDKDKDKDKQDEQNKDNKDNKDDKDSNDQENKNTQENKDQGNKDNKDSKDNNDNKNPDNKQNKEDSQDKENSQDKNNQQQNQDINKEQTQENKDKDNKENQAQISDQNKENNGKENMTEVQQILQLLEQQEEESLKNNQGIKVEGTEAEHDW